ncbi:HvfA family oxazolone/thioamide-modified RiPP metallophore [Halopseudomonas sabulinigri]|uniref:Low-complexity protein n=1 Tax=Halopseudomonas sabulinigri TaxID=472181 RepID=A0A1H1MS18_9GAMM|nr:hypothetical protein [Halopseudomonas sabulinigri]SDR89487.1 hypothetical protein SAMN05216271_0675 [Halopseudomonas sabulinigri]
MNKLNTAIVTLGVTLMGAGASVNAADNPFAVEELQSGYNLADNHGEGDMEGKCGEGSCGEDKGESKGEREGKCGEGTCGS